MITIKVINKAEIIKKLVMIIFIIIIWWGLVCFFLPKDRGNNSGEKEIYFKVLLSDFIGENIPISCINTTLPVIKVIQLETKNHTCKEIDVKWFLKILSGIDLSNPETIINNQIVLFESYNEGRTSTAFASVEKSDEKKLSVASRNGDRNTRIDKAKTGAEKTSEAKNIKEGDGRHLEEKRISASIKFKNETGLTIDAEQLLNEELNIDLSGEEPKVLIVHAHTSESYTPTEKFYYAPTDPDRTEDANFNVVRVGEEIAKYLMEKGINVVHDKTIHDYPSYSGSYQRALETTTKQLKKYPSIEVVLDIHRDGFIYGDGSKLRTATNIEGKLTSKVMFVIGTNQRGLHHPNWRENLKLAVHLQQEMNIKYPGLARPINLRNERFNQHASTGALLIEVGSNGDTLEEALASCKYIAEVLTNVLRKQST